MGPDRGRLSCLRRGCGWWRPRGLVNWILPPMLAVLVMFEAMPVPEDGPSLSGAAPAA